MAPENKIKKFQSEVLDNQYKSKLNKGCNFNFNEQQFFTPKYSANDSIANNLPDIIKSES